jgi:arsenite/tail-anchored protein-transporting ATPase
MSKLILFTGKGGVGKSTTSAATALNFSLQGYKTLLVSSDPAHSTEDVIGIQVGFEPTFISENFYAKNINSELRAKEFIGKLNDGLDKNMSKWFPGFDSELLTEWASFPGMDEVFALEELLHLVRGVEYDLIVFDTAPTGHTLKALTAPDYLNTFLLRILRMKAKVQNLKTMFLKKSDTSKLVDLLEETIDMVDSLKKVLRNSDFVNVNIVSIATEAGFQECIKTVNFLNTQGFKIDNILINNIVPKFDDDTWSLASKNKAVALLKMEYDSQKVYISRYNDYCISKNINLCGVSKMPFEPRDSKLKEFVKFIWGDGGLIFKPSKSIVIKDTEKGKKMKLLFPIEDKIKLKDDIYLINGFEYKIPMPSEFENLTPRKKKDVDGATYYYRI